VIFLLIGWRFGAAYGITSPAPDQP
jgi:hypothetical protein